MILSRERQTPTVEVQNATMSYLAFLVFVPGAVPDSRRCWVWLWCGLIGWENIMITEIGKNKEVSRSLEFYFGLLLSHTTGKSTWPSVFFSFCYFLSLWIPRQMTLNSFPIYNFNMLYYVLTCYIMLRNNSLHVLNFLNVFSLYGAKTSRHLKLSFPHAWNLCRVLVVIRFAFAFPSLWIIAIHYNNYKIRMM